MSVLADTQDSKDPEFKATLEYRVKFISNFSTIQTHLLKIKELGQRVEPPEV